MRSPRLLLLCAFAACLPWPHTAWDWPEIAGQLIQNGEPLPGVDIGLRAPGDSPVCRAVTRTDARGFFHVPSDRHLELLMWFGDKLDDWALCFQLPGGQRELKQSGMFGGPRAERLRCVVSSDATGVDCAR